MDEIKNRSRSSGFFIVFCLEEEILDLAVQHQQHAQRGDDLHADVEESSQLKVLSLQRDFLIHNLGADFPTDAQAHQ